MDARAFCLGDRCIRVLAMATSSWPLVTKLCPRPKGPCTCIFHTIVTADMVTAFPSRQRSPAVRRRRSFYSRSASLLDIFPGRWLRTQRPTGSSLGSISISHYLQCNRLEFHASGRTGFFLNREGCSESDKSFPSKTKHIPLLPVLILFAEVFSRPSSIWPQVNCSSASSGPWRTKRLVSPIVRLDDE